MVFSFWKFMSEKCMHNCWLFSVYCFPEYSFGLISLFVFVFPQRRGPDFTDPIDPLSLSLPTGWIRLHDPVTGRYYFQDHNHCITQWWYFSLASWSLCALLWLSSWVASRSLPSLVLYRRDPRELEPGWLLFLDPIAQQYYFYDPNLRLSSIFLSRREKEKNPLHFTCELFFLCWDFFMFYFLVLASCSWW